MTTLMIALGGAVGATLRHGVNRLVVVLAGAPTWPFGTLAVNVLGSFALGMLIELGPGRTLLGVDQRLVLGTGLLGGFTTYSTFSAESVVLAEQGAWGRLGSYVLVTLFVSFAAAALGFATIRWLRPVAG